MVFVVSVPLAFMKFFVITSGVLSISESQITIHIFVVKGDIRLDWLVEPIQDALLAVLWVIRVFIAHLTLLLDVDKIVLIRQVNYFFFCNLLFNWSVRREIKVCFEIDVERLGDRRVLLEIRLKRRLSLLKRWVHAYNIVLYTLHTLFYPLQVFKNICIEVWSDGSFDAELLWYHLFCWIAFFVLGLIFALINVIILF